jgi:capsule biosynthesis phosphatase
MIAGDNVLVVDIDGTLCPIKSGAASYAELPGEAEMIARLRALSDEGWRIVLQTSRGMRTYSGNVGEINRHVLPVLLDWLHRRDVPFHEIHTGKPWAGSNGYYVDDRAVRPREFVSSSFAELKALCDRDRIARG